MVEVEDSSGTVPHYWQGSLPTAFVFSVPGSREASNGRPVAGVTGENLSFALEHLNSVRPLVFSSTDRYAYRITNAFDRPMAKSLGDKSSEARDDQIKTSENVRRVLAELDGCNLVVLCGLKANLLAESVCLPDRKVVCVSHTSNQALSSKYPVRDVANMGNSLGRRRRRAMLWARDVLFQMDSIEAPV